MIPKKPIGGLGRTRHLFRDSSQKGLTREKLKTWQAGSTSTGGHEKGPPPMG